MSIKIYNSLIIKNKNLNQVYNLLREIKPDCVDLAFQSAQSKLLSLKMSDFDRLNNFCYINQDLNKIKNTTFFMEEIIKAKKSIAINNVRNVDYDYTFSVSIVPYEKHTILFYYLENLSDFYIEKLKSIGFEDFHYQNSTDKPENISSEEWNNREKAFKDIGCFSNSVSQFGLTFNIVDWNDYDLVWSKLNITDCNILMDKRKNNIAEEILILECDILFKEKRNYRNVLKYLKKNKNDTIKRVLLSKQFNKN